VAATGGTCGFDANYFHGRFRFPGLVLQLPVPVLTEFIGLWFRFLLIYKVVTFDPTLLKGNPA